MPKQTTEKKAVRHDPLAVDILNADKKRNLREVPRKKRRNSVREENENEIPTGLSAKLTQKVLNAAKEMHDEDAPDMEGAIDVSEEEIEEIVDVDDDGFVRVQDYSAEEENAFSMFLQKEGSKGTTLADLILDKIKQQEAKNEAKAPDGMSPKVIEAYTSVGKWLKTYKSGQLPKAFKIIPNLANWEEVLYLTAPIDWSPGACREAIKIFASNFNAKMAQRFYNLVLLPAVRQNVSTHKKLNFHYYEALKKAFFKPAAFFKGILLPLAQENCTLREAVIVSSILTKISIPVLHSAAAIVRLATMKPWFGTTSIFMTALINKKYSLPHSVIGVLTDHFCSFEHDERTLPVVWHRCLLTFVQRYKNDIKPLQRNRLKELLRNHCHEGMGPEIRRELFSTVVHNAMDCS